MAVSTPPPPEVRHAGLVYVTDADPGISRRRSGKGFSYALPDGSPVRDRAVQQRIRSLSIPPAYTGVWICLNPLGHLQATGRDSRQRKQYRYHPAWRVVRDATKFGRMLAFGQALPRIRARVAADLAAPDLPRTKVLAALVRLLEGTLVRVGNESYAAENGSYGLTTLRKRHTEIAGGEIRFEFAGKSGKQHQVALRDRRVAAVLRRCQDLPGQRLFQYVDEAGERHAIASDDVNAYLRDISGEEFTAKDFRTWAGTVAASIVLAQAAAPSSATAAKRIVADCVRQVAAVLNNTPAVCRKSYVHPAIVEAYENGQLRRRLGLRGQATPDEFDLMESAVLALLRRLESRGVRAAA